MPDPWTDCFRARSQFSITALQAEDVYTYLVFLTTLWPESIGSWAEWATVVVTLGAVVIGLRTLRAIRHLVVANRDAAEPPEIMLLPLEILPLRRSGRL